MNKDRIIELLEQQIAHLHDQIKQLLESDKEKGRLILELTAQVSELTATIRSLEQALTLKDGKLKKQEHVTRGIAKLLSNESERQTSPESEPTPPQTPAPKERGNNKARRKEHFEVEEKIIEVNPDHPLFNRDLATFIGHRDSIRYVYIPPKFMKYIYRQNIYSFNGTVVSGSAPDAPLLNSSYDGSFVAGLCQLRYIYSMSVERIVNFFRESGFELEKPTAHHLLAKTAGLFENLYKALEGAMLEDPYLSCDESYHKVLVTEKNSKGKGVRKGYIWGAVAVNRKLVHYFYEDGSRREAVILNYLKDYRGTVQSDSYAAYKKLETDEYPKIRRIACLQHIKRKFLDAENDPDAQTIIKLTNRLYQKEHEHRIGLQGWTVEDNCKYRRKYAPKILREIKLELLRIKLRPDLPPKSELAEAVKHMLSQWNAIEGIFTRGDYHLDNNLIERYNRYISLSRRNSLFFGSHKGAERGALFYSLACSCRMQGINTFEYIADVIGKAAKLPPNAELKVYRELLPDKWKENKYNK